MLIVCPTCATSYMIDPASLGRAGRTVRCARCKTAWFAGGPKRGVSDFVADVIAEAEARSPLPAKRSGEPHATLAAAPDDFGEEPSQPAAALHEQQPPEAEETVHQPDERDRMPVAQAPSLVPPIGEPLPARASHDTDDIESFAARRARMQVRRKTKRRSSKWTAVILVLFGFNVALIGARNEVVRYLPQTSSLFAAVGLQVNLRHLTFDDVKITKEDRDGVGVLVVEGTIASVSDKAVEVPRLRFAARNATGQEIYSWTALPDRSILQPGEKLPFRSRLASPPADASDVLVRFFNARDAATGTK